MSGSGRSVRITCLGCGLLCDDVSVSVSNGQVSGFSPACGLGAAWIGTGVVPDRIRADGTDVPFESAISTATSMLASARGNALVYLGPGLTIEALKPSLALADRLAAVVDTATSAAAAAGILAGQRRGRAAATLGELLNRADVVLLWGVDPERTHPRLIARLVDPPGTHVPDGRRSRTVASVCIGGDGARTAEVVLHFPATGELAALGLLRSIVAGTSLPAAAALMPGLAELAGRLATARYVAIVAGAEDADAARMPQRSEGLIALAQALNGPTRAALFTLRSGDNRNGVEALLTWQTGYPFAVDFRSGVPAYSPDRRGLDDLGGITAALLLGDWRAIAPAGLAALRELPCVVIGPGASDMPGRVRVAIDAGRAGVHEGGTAYRMDDVPLSVRAALDGPRTAAMVLGALEDAVSHALREVPA